MSSYTYNVQCKNKNKSFKIITYISLINYGKWIWNTIKLKNTERAKYLD